MVIDAQDDDLLGLNFNLSSTPSSPFSIRRKPRAPKGEFLKWDTTEVANHITLMESRAYNKIRPHECLSWTRSSKGPGVIYLTNFISMSDRLATWVKLSILTCESLGKRADMIDHWIKIAEVRSRLPAHSYHS
jgi:son of sevenless-like protein